MVPTQFGFLPYVAANCHQILSFICLPGITKTMSGEEESLLRQGEKNYVRRPFGNAVLIIDSHSCQYATLSGEDQNSFHSKTARSASISAIGGMQSLGTFQFKETPNVKGLPRSYSVSADGSPSYLTPTQMGRQELYKEVPFTAVFGLQRKERTLSQAFALSAAELSELDTTTPSSPEEKSRRMSRTSMVILDELEFDANVVTMPLVFAIVVAATSQFLVGYNTGVMNAPVNVVFPGHSTLSWSLAVAAFAVGGPFGAIAGGQMADKRGRRGALLIDTWTFLLGGLLQTVALDMFTIITARFIIGFASGFSTVLVPIYLGELAPPTMRGMLGTGTYLQTPLKFKRLICSFQ